MNVIIDEIAKRAFEICDKLGITHPSHREMFVGGYREGLKANPWHKTSEELPKEDGTYIVMLGRNSFICALDFDAISKQWSIAGYQNDVKYWMEIPEIPEMPKED